MRPQRPERSGDAIAELDDVFSTEVVVVTGDAVAVTVQQPKATG
jgi:hypothetical protein